MSVAEADARRAPASEDVPPGYKRTEVGVIPEEWECAAVGDLFQFLPTASNSRADLSDAGDAAYVHYGDIHTRWNHFLDFASAEVPRIQRIRAGNAAAVRDGDLIVADASEDEEGIGKSVEVRDLGTALAVSGLHTLLLRPKECRTSDGYRGYLLCSAPVRDQFRAVANGLKVFGLSKQALRGVLLPLPPLPEQRAIAAALSDVDGLIEALDELIAKKRAIKQGAMQELLTGKTRLPGFSGEWETRRLGEILTFLPTASNPRADLTDEGGVEYIHYGDIHGHSGSILDCSAAGLPRIWRGRVGNAAPLVDGDIVMVDASEDLEGVGKSVEVHGVGERLVVAGLHTILCRGRSGQWAPGFKGNLQFIPAFRAALTRVASGISVYAISKSQLAEVELALPPLDEQGAIAATLTDMDEEIAALERRRDKTRLVKQGMMQQLLTGRTRLI